MHLGMVISLSIALVKKTCCMIIGNRLDRGFGSRTKTKTTDDQGMFPRACWPQQNRTQHFPRWHQVSLKNSITSCTPNLSTSFVHLLCSRTPLFHLVFLGANNSNVSLLPVQISARSKSTLPAWKKSKAQQKVMVLLLLSARVETRVSDPRMRDFFPIAWYLYVCR